MTKFGPEPVLHRLRCFKSPYLSCLLSRNWGPPFYPQGSLSWHKWAPRAFPDDWYLKNTSQEGQGDTGTPRSFPRLLPFLRSSSASSQCVFPTVGLVLALCRILAIFCLPFQNPFLATWGGGSVWAASAGSMPSGFMLDGEPDWKSKGGEWGQSTYCSGSFPTGLFELNQKSWLLLRWPPPSDSPSGSSNCHFPLPLRSGYNPLLL